MAYSFPNQRVIIVKRELIEKDFLGIKNENWMAAAKDLKAQALMLYMYFAANANNYRFAFSPKAVFEQIGMPRSTCRDQFDKLVSMGYLVETAGNTYTFYEKPQTCIRHSKVELNAVPVVSEENYTVTVMPQLDPVQSDTAENREINNNKDGINRLEINNNEIISQKPSNSREEKNLAPWEIPKEGGVRSREFIF